jgi:Spy/CpxP family protein refolding chaperone
MKKVSLSILALMVSIAILQAQEKSVTPQQQTTPAHKHYGKHGMKHGKHGMDFKKLNLTQEQKDKMKGINSDFHLKMTDLKKQEATITVKDYKAQMKELGKKRHEQIRGILTQGQKDQLVKMRADAKKRGGEMAQKRMEKMKTELQLSDDQSAKIKALQAGTKQKIKTIREDKSLTDEQKKEQVKATFKKQHDEMNSLLTPEQVKKMEYLKPKRMHNEAK